MTDARIAAELRSFQAGLGDWDHAPLVRELHRWVPIFDLEFKLDLPGYPVLQFRPLRNAYATYQRSRGEVGTRDNITFNTHELARDPALILRTLCHELLHLWQAYHGNPGARNYHNAEFRRRAAACGLVVTAQGCTTGHTVVFTDVLARHGVQLVPQVAEARLWGAAKRPQKLARYRCACTTVRCATELAAVCQRCDAPFCRA